MREGFIAVEEGVRLFFCEAGQGSDVVLLPNGVHLLDDFRPFADGRRLVFYDVRHRGRSERVEDESKLARGILNDADDIEAVRRFCGAERIDLIGHSYIGSALVLYAMAHPDRVRRIVLLGPMPPDPATQYPPHLTNHDDVLREALASIAALQKERSSLEPRTLCERFWKIVNAIYVADPADAWKIKWSFCEQPNERNLMKYWTGQILPSIQKLRFTREQLAAVTAAVLIVHGRLDRSSPYGGGCDWASLLPNARLLTVERAAHVPWIEAPDLVFGSIETFLATCCSTAG